RKSLVVVALLGLFGLARPAMAQKDTPKFEASAGYSYIHVRDQDAGASANFQGGSASIAYNFKPWLGFIGEFGGYGTRQFTDVAPIPGSHTALLTYMIGPRLTLSRSKWQPWFQFIGGGGTVTNAFTKSGSDTEFVMAAGGGLDVRIKKNIRIRPV